MLCDNCQKEQATVYVRRTVNNETTEAHLCERCAREQGDWNLLIGPSLAFPDFSLGNLFASLMDQQQAAVITGSNVQSCPNCGLTYNDFRQRGRLGCANCYTSFRQSLDPLIRRLQGGTRHTGKIPRRYGSTAPLRQDLEKLKQQLKAAVAKEEFEQAAKLRDEIKLAEERLAGGQ
ncbi:MAG: UvrB/UvrC motif-containing protein [bacterium]|jgi:protein arginine kinase activator